MQILETIKKIKLVQDIWRNDELWITMGEYSVEREFDKKRYLISTDEGLTIVPKFLTQPLS